MDDVCLVFFVFFLTTAGRLVWSQYLWSRKRQLTFLQSSSGECLSRLHELIMDEKKKKNMRMQPLCSLASAQFQVLQNKLVLLSVLYQWQAEMAICGSIYTAVNTGIQRQIWCIIRHSQLNYSFHSSKSEIMGETLKLYCILFYLILFYLMYIFFDMIMNNGSKNWLSASSCTKTLVWYQPSEAFWLNTVSVRNVTWGWMD